ncbi:hypothetical protein BDW42DRAFT_179073 [Aspergillus taichungensis]|uniref:Uncharacterized protein n=1 Tax=Aspergillus taichungensis TaxID=482145 RepID=A0A2J5HHG1_9EURO|nr:hypothetical protein BDW42DRAFT_179073 [Aspergillus taichungensis]
MTFVGDPVACSGLIICSSYFISISILLNETTLCRPLNAMLQGKIKPSQNASPFI